MFLDRDGTLVEDPGYVFRVADYAPLAGVTEGLSLLQDAGYGLAIVTNQSGIGRGYYTAADFERFQSHLVADFAARGVQILATFHCPHLPDADCACRKPRTGMLERARDELGADLARSWVVGDSASDVGLAANAGCRAVHLRGSGQRPGDRIAPNVVIATDLIGAARAILSEPHPDGS